MLAVDLRMALNIYSSCLHLLNFQITGVDHFSCSVLCYTSNQELHPARQALHQLSPGPAPGPVVWKFLLCTVYGWRAGSYPSRPEGGRSVLSVLIMSLFVCVFVFILTCLYCCSPGIWFSVDIPGMCVYVYTCMYVKNFIFGTRCFSPQPLGLTNYLLGALVLTVAS